MTAAATTTQPARRNMRDRVRIGQAWRRNSGSEIGVIRQIHRADREVELLGVEGIRCVSFATLRRYWTEVLDAPGTPLGTDGVNHPTAPTPPAAPRTHRSLPRGAAGTTFKPARRGGIQPLPGRSDLEFFIQHPINKETGMQLPTTKSTREARDPRDARVLLVAPPKTGKTTLAAAWAPDTTLILDTHRGSTLLDGEHYVQHIQNFTEFEAAIDLVATGGHQFRTIVVDLIEHVYKRAEQAAAERFGKDAAGLVEYGKGTNLAEALFTRAVDKLLATPYGIWFLSHVETIQDGNQITYIPKIDKRVRTYIEGSVDFALLAEARGPNRQLQTAPSARYQIGSRVELPNPMPLDARALYVAIAQGLAKPKPAPTPEAADQSTSNGAPAAQEALAA